MWPVIILEIFSVCSSLGNRSHCLSRCKECCLPATRMNPSSIHFLPTDDTEGDSSNTYGVWVDSNSSKWILATSFVLVTPFAVKNDRGCTFFSTSRPNFLALSLRSSHVHILCPWWTSLLTLLQVLTMFALHLLTRVCRKREVLACDGTPSLPPHRTSSWSHGNDQWSPLFHISWYLVTTVS